MAEPAKTAPIRHLHRGSEAIPHACVEKRVVLESRPSRVEMTDDADLEQLATLLEQSGDYRILRRVQRTPGRVTRSSGGSGNLVLGVV
jgi:hypothetical protein